MENARIKLAAQLLGVKPEELMNALGIEEEQIPETVGGFYYNPDVFARLHSIDTVGLRKLVMPNLSRLRR